MTAASIGAQAWRECVCDNGSLFPLVTGPFSAHEPPGDSISFDDLSQKYPNIQLLLRTMNGEWYQEYDETYGSYYYVNATTNETSWEAPPGWEDGSLYDDGSSVLFPADSQGSMFLGGESTDSALVGGKSEYEFTRDGAGGSKVSEAGLASVSEYSEDLSHARVLGGSTLETVQEGAMRLEGEGFSNLNFSSLIDDPGSSMMEGSSALSLVGMKSVKGINPKGRRVNEFPTLWKMPDSRIATEKELYRSSALIFGDPRASLLRINQWTADKPQRYYFSTEDEPPEEGWDYCYSFFVFSHMGKDTHLFQIQHKTDPCLRSKLVRTLITSRNRDLERALIEDHKKVCGGDRPGVRTLEFFARYEPQPGLIQINCQDMQAPDRHKITPKPPVGYWFQRFPFFAFSASLWNVQEYPDPHHFRIVPQGQSSTTDPGWEQCYAFWAFDKPFSGMIPITVLEQAFYPGKYSGDFGDPSQEDPKSYNKPRDWEELNDPGPIMLKLRQVQADSQTYQKFAQDGKHSGWDLVHKFYAFSAPVRGTTRFYVQCARNPTRFRIDLEMALPPWHDCFVFYSWLVKLGDEHILNFPRVTSL